jgi:hypothetical protein
VANGYIPVPVPHKNKSPGFKGWPTFDPTDKGIDHYFNGEPKNIGVLLGEPSRGLTDLDLDCPEALSVALAYLPETGLVSGRPGNPTSHHFYICQPCSANATFEDIDGTMLVEIRSTGLQTLIPPSVHPSGDTYSFVSPGPPS